MCPVTEGTVPTGSVSCVQQLGQHPARCGGVKTLVIVASALQTSPRSQSHLSSFGIFCRWLTGFRGGAGVKNSVMAKGLDILDVSRARKINLCRRQLKILHGFRRDPRAKKEAFALNVVLPFSPPASVEAGTHTTCWPLTPFHQQQAHPAGEREGRAVCLGASPTAAGMRITCRFGFS